MQLHLLFRLNTAKQNKHGVCPVEIRLTYQRQRRQLASGHFLASAEWDILQSGTKTKVASILQVKAYMETFRAKVLRIANSLELENRMDLDTLLDICLDRQKGTVTLLQLFAQHQEELQKRIRIDRSKATFAKYRYTEDKLKAFLQVRYQRKDIPIHNWNLLSSSTFMIICSWNARFTITPLRNTART